MNSEKTSGMWQQFKGKIKAQWAKLTEDDLKLIEGKRDQLVGKIKQRYGCSKEQAEKEVHELEAHNRNQYYKVIH